MFQTRKRAMGLFDPDRRLASLAASLGFKPASGRWVFSTHDRYDPWRLAITVSNPQAGDGSFRPIISFHSLEDRLVFQTRKRVMGLFDHAKPALCPLAGAVSNPQAGDGSFRLDWDDPPIDGQSAFQTRKRAMGLFDVMASHLGKPDQEFQTRKRAMGLFDFRGIH